MSDHSTPNLPSRDFEVTRDFYHALGFIQGWHDAGWMILSRGAISLEFFPYPELDPANSWFSCCLRLDDLDAFYAVCRDAGVPEQEVGCPRLQPERSGSSGPRIAHLIDPDGSLIRLIQNHTSSNG